jgi:hypothetical protein
LYKRKKRERGKKISGSKQDEKFCSRDRSLNFRWESCEIMHLLFRVCMAFFMINATQLVTFYYHCRRCMLRHDTLFLFMWHTAKHEVSSFMRPFRQLSDTHETLSSQFISLSYKHCGWNQWLHALYTCTGHKRVPS